jgi:transglutaminase-like putative cysteine protease
MFYAIRHFTSYRYSRYVWQSMMEVRMHPRSEGNQRCFVFQLSVNPRARIFGYTDSYGNLVHHFDLPSRHNQLTIIADALVNIEAQPPVPELMEYESWNGSGTARRKERLLGHADAESFCALIPGACGVGKGDRRD